MINQRVNYKYTPFSDHLLINWLQFFIHSDNKGRQMIFGPSQIIQIETSKLKFSSSAISKYQKIRIVVRYEEELGYGSFSKVVSAEIINIGGGTEKLDAVCKISKIPRQIWEGMYILPYDNQALILQKVKGLPHCIDMLAYFQRQNKGQQYGYLFLQKWQTDLSMIKKELKNNPIYLCQYIDQMVSFLYCIGNSANIQTPIIHNNKLASSQAILQYVSWQSNIAIIHKDIKLKNILFTKDKSQLKIAICDFGIASIYDNASKKNICQSYGGSKYHQSPEMIGKKGYNCKTDVWSFAMTILEIMNVGFRNNSFIPFQDSRFHQIVGQVDLSVFLEKQEKVRTILANCLKINQQERWDSRTLNYYWFNHDQHQPMPNNQLAHHKQLTLNYRQLTEPSLTLIDQKIIYKLQLLKAQIAFSLINQSSLLFQNILLKFQKLIIKLSSILHRRHYLMINYDLLLPNSSEQTNKQLCLLRHIKNQMKFIKQIMGLSEFQTQSQKISQEMMILEPILRRNTKFSKLLECYGIVEMFSK